MAVDSYREAHAFASLRDQLCARSGRQARCLAPVLAWMYAQAWSERGIDGYDFTAVVDVHEKVTEYRSDVRGGWAR